MVPRFVPDSIRVKIRVATASRRVSWAYVHGTRSAMVVGELAVQNWLISPKGVRSISLSRRSRPKSASGSAVDPMVAVVLSLISDVLMVRVGPVMSALAAVPVSRLTDKMRLPVSTRACAERSKFSARPVFGWEQSRLIPDEVLCVANASIAVGAPLTVALVSVAALHEVTSLEMGPD